MRKRTNRKVWPLVNPIAHVLEGMADTPKDLLDKLRMRELSAIESFRMGRAHLQDWEDMNAVLNLCETMARGGVGPEALPACALAQAELLSAAKRFEGTKRMGLTAQGLEAFRHLCEWHDLQRQSIPRGDYEKWIKKTGDRVRSKSPEVVDVAEYA